MYKQIIEKIKALDGPFAKLSDEELQEKSKHLKEQAQSGTSLDRLLPEAFALGREAAARTVHMKPYIEQMICGIVLHKGAIAEAETGSGKTLAAVLPAYLNALTGKGVHVVTVNDYLAERDATEMGPIYEFLGLTVGFITSEMKSEQRRAAYACDITYVTNNEVGFDYLRDNMVAEAKNRVQRGLHYAIIDEADSILIDEARTPLIISGADGESSDLYLACDTLAKRMERGEDLKDDDKEAVMNGKLADESGDYMVSEKHKTVKLTQRGIEKAETFFGVENLSENEYNVLRHGILTAIKANALYQNDRDYVVRKGAIELVDEFTGRILPGRRYSDGLHQALEAKERVKVLGENCTWATVTFQNFFNKYEKKSGMTGTAKTEEREFRNIYEMRVVVIPPHKKRIRTDLPDEVFLTIKKKNEEVIRETKEAHEKGQPVLIGTADVQSSEHLHRLLTNAGIPHTVLNAKQDAEEAAIIAKAGQVGAVTVATNMAGRGTDIKLGKGAAECGGLYVIGTVRNDSRRIDNQLRGRSGRQGDPGKTRFLVSMEDRLLRIYGEGVLFQKLKERSDPDTKLEGKSIQRVVSRTQKRIEGENFGIRKSLMDFDSVKNEQREIIYRERNRILDGANIHESVLKMIHTYIADLVKRNWKKKGKNENFLQELSDHLNLEPTDVSGSKKAVIKQVSAKAIAAYEKRMESVGAEKLEALERLAVLGAIDEHWAAHLDNLELLRLYIRVEAYGQRDPVVEYKHRAFIMFDEVLFKIRQDALDVLYQIPIEKVNAIEEPDEA